MSQLFGVVTFFFSSNCGQQKNRINTTKFFTMKKQVLISMPISEFQDLINQTIESKIDHLINKLKYEELLDVEETTRRLGVTRVTLYAWRKKGLIKSYKIENRVYFKWSEILECLEEK